MKTTHCSSGGVLFFLHHQKAHFPYPLHHRAGGGRFSPPPHFVTSAVTSEYTHLVLHICRSRRLDSNAASYRTDKSNVTIDEDEESDDILQQLDDNLQDYIDSLWIFKVFKSYGYMLPFIILSMILTTGLKAFLLALALPIGLSTFSYAIQKMQEHNKSGITKPRQKSKTNNKKRSQTQSSENRNVIKKSGNKSRGPPSNDNNDSVDQNAVSYGGWDELDRVTTEYIILDSSESSSSSSSDQTDNGGGSYKRTSQVGESSSNSKMTESDRTRPLLLRLLIAVFPFLGSWI